MKLCVCSLAIGEEYRKAIHHCMLSLKKYCNKHNYPLITDDTYAIHDRDYMWSKVPLIRKTLPNYDYVVWIDGDMMIMNDNVRLEHFIDLYLGNRETLLSTDCGNQINTGFWILKNSQYCHDLLSIIENLPELAGNFHEQGVFNELYTTKNLFNIRQKAIIIPEVEQRLCNATIYNYVYGDFLIHFLGIRVLENLSRLDVDHYPHQKGKDDKFNFDLRTNWMKEKYENVRNPRYVLPGPKITIEMCTFFTGDKYSDDVVHYGQKSMMLYAKKHGYTFHVQRESLTPHLPSHWTKLALLVNIMVKTTSDYIVWFDADIMIINHDIKIEGIIEKHMNCKDFLLNKDVSEEINTGVCIVRNTEYSRKVLELMLNLPELRYRGCEDQDTFNRIYQRNIMNFQDHCTILPSSQQTELNPCVGFYKWGVWLIHFYSLSKDGLRKAFNDFYPFLKDREDMGTFQSRSDWLRNW